MRYGAIVVFGIAGKRADEEGTRRDNVLSDREIAREAVVLEVRDKAVVEIRNQSGYSPRDYIPYPFRAICPRDRGQLVGYYCGMADRSTEAIAIIGYYEVDLVFLDDTLQREMFPYYSIEEIGELQRDGQCQGQGI